MAALAGSLAALPVAALGQQGAGAPGSIEIPAVEWAGLLPLLILVSGALVLMLVGSMGRGRPVAGGYALFTAIVAGCAIAAAAALWQRVQDPDRGPFSTVAGAFGVDGFSVFLTVVICASVILGALLLDGFLRREGMEGADPFVLMLLSGAGGVIMASANDLIVMFIGLEVLSLAAYVLAAMHLRRVSSQEAGVKYFVLGALASAFFLYGIALVYGGTGSTNLADIAAFFAGSVLVEDGLVLAGMALLLVGFGFKVAAVPFHFWAPDVYQGAPSPTVAFMAAGVKVAAFAGLLRVFHLGFDAYRVDWRPIVYVLAVLTLVGGAVLAVAQADVKRMMAYSSVNHAGFILLGVQAGTGKGVEAALFYLAAYTFMIAGAFGVITVVGRLGDVGHSLDAYRGLSRSRPLLALVFALLLFAQAGVPLTSGFVAKFYAITAALDGGARWLAVVAMLSAVVAAYVYLRIVVAMYMSGPDAQESAQPATATHPVPSGAALALALAVGATLLVGFWPAAVADFAADATLVLVAATP